MMDKSNGCQGELHDFTAVIYKDRTVGEQASRKVAGAAGLPSKLGKFVSVTVLGILNGSLLEQEMFWSHHQVVIVLTHI